MKRNSSIWFAGVGVAVALGMSNAQALEISFDFNNPEQTTEISQTGTLGLFDTALGTLTSVSLELIGSATTTITLTSEAAQAQTVSATSQVNLFFDESALGADLGIPDPALVLEISTGFETLLPGDSATFGPESDNDELALLYDLGNPLLDVFKADGGGSFDLGCNSLTGLNVVGGGGNVIASQQTIAGCGAKITYEYEPGDITVPTPGTLALLALGLIAGGGIHRRRRAA